MANNERRKGHVHFIMCSSPTNLTIVLLLRYIMTSLLKKYIISKNGHFMPIMAIYVGEIIATQRRATPTQRHAKHGSTLKEKLAFLSGTMDFHKPNGSEQIKFFPNIPENIFGNDQREFYQYRIKKNYFRSRRCV